jgi:Lar family restriction alleviation protein
VKQFFLNSFLLILVVSALYAHYRLYLDWVQQDQELVLNNLMEEMNEMEMGIRQCPFCGNQESPYVYAEGLGHWHVKCTLCGAKGPLHALATQAVDKWNERAGEKYCPQCGAFNGLPHREGCKR